MNEYIRPTLDSSRTLSTNSRPAAARPAESVNRQGASFADLLQNARTGREPVTISVHAAARLQSRGLAPTPRMLQKLSEATDMLAAKRAKESLVVVDQVGFVVNVPNRTVVTAMALRAGGSPQLFTNIDSAVWMDQ